MEENNRSYKTFSLLIVFGEIPKIGITASHPQQKVIIDEEIYVESKFGEFNGHYDWLFNPSGKIIGIRYFIFEELNFLTLQLKDFSYCELDDDLVTIYFSSDKEIDEENSIDQDFCGDRLFYSYNNELMMSFHIAGISKKSLQENIKYDCGDFLEI